MEHVEDTVSYWLYPTTSHTITCPTTTLARVCTHLSPFTSAWVWHKQGFALKVVEEGNVWWLSGSSCYADNVMDEWFIVSLLREVTMQFPGLVGRVVDSDGEILLIEAANHIPSWAAEPSVASGRVFLQGGDVHIIPVCDHPGQVTPLPAVTPPPGVCAQVVSAYPHLTRASTRVQQDILDRLDNMPRNTDFNHHTCTVSLPSMVAKLLVKDKSLLGKMVEAVVERDQVDIRQARSMSRVKQVEMKDFSIKWSRCLYAMLSSCKVRPSKGCGWLLREEKGELTGFKLAMGLEILLSRAREGEKGEMRGKEWEKFLSKLKDVGYFQGELEGSLKFTELCANAKTFWKDSNTEENFDINDAMKLVDNERDSDIGGIVGPSGVNEGEDWLEVTPDSLDKMLEAQFGVSKDAPGQNIPEEVTKFLGKMSDMAGVEHEEGMKFDPENLVNSMKKLMGEMESETGMFDGDSDSDSESDSGEDDPIMMDYMQRLDREVLDKNNDSKDMPDLDKPLDVDASVLSNLLASYSAQTGLGGHGPASSLFQSIRLNPGRPDL